MKTPPRAVIAVVALALVAVAGWAAFGRGEDEARWLGSVEAETLYIAAPVAGRLAERPVERGGQVAEGAPLFTLDPEMTEAETARAEADVAGAEARAEDLSAAAQRPPELDAARAGEAAALATLTRAQRDYERMAALAGRGFASRAQLDAALAARNSASATLAQTRAEVRAGQQTAGREAQRRAAGATVAGAEASLRAQRQRGRDIAPVSPAKGVIEQTFYEPGEWVPANAPVVSVLPDARRKLRFYVPQERIAALRPGSTVRFTCDGCGTGHANRIATISYIAPRAEFSPPVIYSERARARLVFLVEAALAADARPLPPGLPVEVIPR